MSTNTNFETTERLNIILESVDKPLAEDLFNQFYILNPLEFAKLLHALALPDAVKAQLLALRVGLPTPYTGVDLAPLIEKAMMIMWNRLGAENQI